MAPGRSTVPSEGNTEISSSYRQSFEERLSSSTPINGPSLTLNGTYSSEKTKSPRGVFSGGPYIVNESMTSLSTQGMDGALTSRISRDEGRFEISGPYASGFDQTKKSQTGRSTQISGDSIYDPEGFGDDLDDEESPFPQLAPPSRPAPGHYGNGSGGPPAPRHAPPPPPPSSGSYPPNGNTRPNPPITVTTTQRRRAQSESSPPSSPPPVGGSFLSPPPIDPPSTHRKSSPPAPRLDQAPSSPTNPGMPRLQQRHTLQVPQIVPPRSSRDLSSGDESTGRNTSPTISNRRTSMNLIRRHSRSLNSDMHLNEVPQDEDAARRSELMKQKLIARRKRKEEEDEDRVLVGTRVDQNHQNWVTAYNMLTGIRFTVSRTNAKIRDHELNEADFNAKHKYAFDVTGSELTPSAKYDFKFKDYAPQVFKELRSMFGIDPADYLVSLTSKILLSELASPGKSKSFFYFSRDYKYIIKTVHHAEHKLLRKILPRYFEHVKNNPNTLLSQFYGLHRIKSTWGAHKTHFVVMNNLFPPHRDIHQTYDLKGSTVGRELKEEDLEKNPRATLKDLNWMRRHQHLAFGPIIKAQFIQQMERDVELLKELGIMDYSLLVGIHDVNRGNEEGLRDKTLKVYHPGGGNPEKGEESNKDTSGIARTPSHAERTRAARELRATLRKERPVPMTKSGIDLPENNAADRISRVFTKDDGGIQSEQDNGGPGNEIYYLGIIDCLTKYGMVKRIEHFVKGLSHNKNAISAVRPDTYGDRFVAFMKGISKTDEEVAVEKQQQEQEEARQGIEARGRQSASMSLRSQSQPRYSSSIPVSTGVDGASERNSDQQTWPASEEMTPQQQAAERKARRSGENNTAEEHQRTLGTVRSSITQDGTSVTLPVLEEANYESNSSGGRSRNRSHERNQEALSKQVSARSRSEAGQRGERGSSRQENERGSSVPRMPERPAPQAPVYGGRPPPTPPKESATPQIGGLPMDDFGGRFVISPPDGEV